MAVYKNLPVIGPQWVNKQTPSSLDTFTQQTISIFYLSYFLQTTPQNLLCCEIFNTSLKDQAISFYPSHKCLPEKSFLHCLRILIISRLFKDPVVIMKEIMSRLFKDQINSGMAQFYHVQSNSKKWPKGQSRLMRMCHFRAQNDPFVLNNFFLVQTITIIITFIYVVALFIVQGLKILTADPEF